MPEFTPDEAHHFWEGYDDPTVYQVICVMEAAETWALDHSSEVAAQLVELGNKFEHLNDVSEELQKSLLPILAHVRISIKLYIMYSLDMIKMRSAEKLIILAESNHDLPGAAEFIDRNLVFERLRLTSRLFSKERLETVKGVMADV